MHLNYKTPVEGKKYYIIRGFRDKNGKSTSENYMDLGTLAEIREREGVSDAWAWIGAELDRCNEDERKGRRKVKIDLFPNKRIKEGEQSKYSGGDLMLIPLYNALGLPQICQSIQNDRKIRYNLNDILEALVVLHILYPCSKKSSFELNKKRIRKTSFELEDVYKALTLLSGHIGDIQAQVWKNSQKIMARNTRVIFYDCTNYYFEIEDNDRDYVDRSTGEVILGLRKRGKSKEHRPNPT